LAGRELFLVCGGSGGIGAAVCDALAKKGYSPVVGYRSGRAAAEAVAARTGGEAMELDLGSDASIDAVVAELAKREEIVAGVILAASPMPVLATFSEIKAEDMELQWKVNVEGPQRLLAGMVKECFRKERRGVVVGLLTKAMGVESGAFPGRAAAKMGSYVIAKYGMAGVLAALAGDHSWVKVRSVSPGFVETGMLKAFDERFLGLARRKEKFRSAEEVGEEIVGEIEKS